MATLIQVTSFLFILSSFPSSSELSTGMMCPLVVASIDSPFSFSFSYAIFRTFPFMYHIVPFQVISFFVSYCSSHRPLPSSLSLPSYLVLTYTTLFSRPPLVCHRLLALLYIKPLTQIVVEYTLTLLRVFVLSQSLSEKFFSLIKPSSHQQNYPSTYTYPSLQLRDFKSETKYP